MVWSVNKNGNKASFIYVIKSKCKSSCKTIKIRTSLLSTSRPFVSQGPAVALHHPVFGRRRRLHPGRQSPCRCPDAGTSPAEVPISHWCPCELPRLRYWRRVPVWHHSKKAHDQVRKGWMKDFFLECWEIWHLCVADSVLQCSWKFGLLTGNYWIAITRKYIWRKNEKKCTYMHICDIFLGNSCTTKSDLVKVIYNGLKARGVD